MSWVKSFSLVSLQQGVAKLSPQPGHREMVKFLTQPRRDQLAQLMQSVLGSPVRVEVAPGSAPESEAEGAAPCGGGGRASALEQAMSLPLVKQVMELFDAQIVDVRPEGEPPPEPPAAAPQGVPTPAPTAPRPAPPVRPAEAFDDEEEEG